MVPKNQIDTWWRIRNYVRWFTYQLFKTMQPWNSLINSYSFIARYVKFTPVWWSCIEVVNYYGDRAFLIGYCFYENPKIMKNISNSSRLAMWAIKSCYKTLLILFAFNSYYAILIKWTFYYFVICKCMSTNSR